MFPIKVTRRVAAQIRESASWWLVNRPAAAEALKEEIQQAFDLIAQQPALGARATNITLPGIRRIHLSRVRDPLISRKSCFRG